MPQPDGPDDPPHDDCRVGAQQIRQAVGRQVRVAPCQRRVVDDANVILAHDRVEEGARHRERACAGNSHEPWRQRPERNEADHERRSRVCAKRETAEHADNRRACRRGFFDAPRDRQQRELVGIVRIAERIAVERGLRRGDVPENCPRQEAIRDRGRLEARRRALQRTRLRRACPRALATKSLWGFFVVITANRIALALIERQERLWVLRSDVVGAGTNQPVVRILLEAVRRPAGNPTDREDRREEIDRDAQRVIG
jgi:hypothetical protein